MTLTELIHHPQRMDRETLFDLRNLVAMYPYYQPARLLMLQNLYLLHDPTFDEELRRAAIYITNRSVLFELFEAAHYKLRSGDAAKAEKQEEPNVDKTAKANRMTQLIDSFLESLPQDDAAAEAKKQEPKRKPTPADAAVDYVAYLMECDDATDDATPQMKGQSLIDNFLGQEGGRIILPELPADYPLGDKKSDSEGPAADVAKPTEDVVYTETLAKIYIKQGRYSQALKIIKRLNLDNPKKNSYFADQIRFLEKLVVNSKR